MKIKKVVLSILSCFALLASSLPSTAVLVSANETNKTTQGEPQQKVINDVMYVFANGTPITVTYDEDSGTNTVTWTEGSIEQIPTNAIIFGGCHGSDATVNTDVTIDGAKVGSVYGGGLHKSHVENAKVTVKNGAELIWVIGGGANALVHDGECSEGSDNEAWIPADQAANSSTIVDTATVKVEGSDVKVTGAVFGGGQGNSKTGTTTVEIEGGTLEHVIAGGSNGYTGSGTIDIKGGTIGSVQSVNRGVMDSADINVNGGTITDLYIGAEDASDANGTIKSVNVAIGADATVTNFKPGTSGNKKIGDSNDPATDVDYSFSVEPGATVNNYEGVLAEEKDTNNSYYYFTVYNSSNEEVTSEEEVAASKLTNIVQLVNSKKTGKTYQYAAVMANGETVVATDESDGVATRFTCKDGSYVLTNYDAIDFFGGSHNSDVKIPETNITVNGTTHIESVWGGGWHKSQVGTANVTVTGNAEVSSIQGGAANYYSGTSCKDETCSGHNNATDKSKACWSPNGAISGEDYDVDGNARVDKAIVKIDSCAGTYTSPSGTKANTMVYGGGESYAYTGSVELNISGGKFYVVGATGSNGYTGAATVVVSGDDTEVGILASANRGVVGDVDITIEGGTVETLYLGAAGTATIESADVTVSGGTVKKVDFGYNGDSKIDPKTDEDFTVTADGGKIDSLGYADYSDSTVSCNHDKYEKAEEKTGTPATCKANGTYDYWKCGNCGHYFATINDELTDVTNKDGNAVDEEKIVMEKSDKYHVYGELIKEVPATCSTTGAKAHYKCEVCEKLFANDENKTPVEEKDLIIETKEHTPVVDKAVEATCTSTGLTEGSHCKVCNAVIKAQEEIPMIAHTPVVDKAVDATCTSTGLTEGSHCKVCNAVIKAQEEIPMIAHTPVVDEAVEATCTSTGLTEGSHCKVCNEVIKAQEEIPMIAHTPVIDKAVEATCTSTGLTEGSHCKVCNAVIKAQEEIPMIAHTPVVDEAVEATCTSTGLTEGSHCEVCNAVIKAQDVIPALGHNYVNGVCTRDGAKDPSVTTTTSKNVTTATTTKVSEVKQPKLTKLKVTSKSKKKINVLWTKVKGAKGYEIEVSNNKAFKAKGKVLTKTTKKLKLTIKNPKIKSKKTYYVRVRAFTTYKDSSGTTKKVYSSWNYVLRKVKVK